MVILTLISSQKFRDEGTVIKKMNLNRLTIYISPPFTKDGILQAVLIDGHHRFEAAKRTGKVLDVCISKEENMDLIYQDEIDWFLDWYQDENDWHKVGELQGDYHSVN